MFCTQLFNKIHTGIHNYFKLRSELLVRRDDDLPVHVGHSLQDLGRKKGQGVMRLFIRSTWKDLKDYNMVSWEAIFPASSGFPCWLLASSGLF